MMRTVFVTHAAACARAYHHGASGEWRRVGCACRVPL